MHPYGLSNGQTAPIWYEFRPEILADCMKRLTPAIDCPKTPTGAGAGAAGFS